MQGLVLQLTRLGFLLLLWLFVWSIMRGLRADVLSASGLRVIPRAARTLPGAGGSLRGAARQLVVTAGPLTGTRIALGEHPILIGRADDSTLVLSDDYASNKHARFSSRGSDWYLEDLGSTNGTFLDRSRVTTPVRVPLGTPVRIGKTVIELRP